MLTEKTLKYFAGLAVLFGSFLLINTFLPGVGTVLAVATLILVALRGAWFASTLASLFGWAAGNRNDA